MQIKSIDAGESQSVILFSDIHFHEYKPYSKPTTDGIGSRLKWTLDAQNAIFDYAVKHKIRHLFFLGDLFHQRTILYSIVFDRVAECIDRARELGIEIHAILGNHDYIYNNDNSPSIVKKIRGLDVIDCPTLYFLRDCKETIGCIPFRFDAERLKEDVQQISTELLSLTNRPPNHILLGHLELTGALVNDEYVLNSSADPSIFEGTPFKFIFSGHVHRRQTLSTGNGKIIEFVGVPLQHNFNNEGCPYGFTVLNFEDGFRAKFVNMNTLLTVPEFVTIELRSQEDVKEVLKTRKDRFGLDYYRLRSYSDDVKLESILKRLDHYTFEPMRSIGSHETDEEDSGTLKFNLDIRHYLNLFAQQEGQNQNLEWLESPALMEYLAKVAEKGNICLE